MRLRGSMIFRKPVTVIMFDACEEIMIPIIHPTCNVRVHQGLLLLLSSNLFSFGKNLSGDSLHFVDGLVDCFFRFLYFHRCFL